MNIKDELFNGGNIFDLKLRVTYYARVSTDNDSQNSSIVNQKDYFYNYINSIDNWVYVSGYIDEGISGKEVSKRDNFLRMIKDGVDGKFDYILTKSVSRFARNTIDSIKYTDLLKSKGIGVYFINDNINTLSNDSEFRLRKLSESVKFGLRESINRGVVLGNNNILGYDKCNGKLYINKEEAIIVKDIFNLFVTDKYSYRKVALIINNKYNKRFDSTSIKRILTNYKYKGYYCGRKSMVINYKNSKRISISPDNWIIYKDNINVPSIVSEDIWDRVNNIINNRYNNRGKYNVMCGIHNKRCMFIKKKYRNNIYKYYYCKGCSSIKLELIDKMCLDYKVKYIYIYNYNDYMKVILIINI